MFGKLGFDRRYTMQEGVARRALTITLLIMAVMPLPFCVWNSVGWLAYVLYLLPLSSGLYPLLTESFKEKITFHCLIGVTLIIVACSIIALPHLVLPFFFVLLTLYLVYWQLEKRLFAIRRSLLLQEYRYHEIDDADARELVRELLRSLFKKAVIPAAAGTLCCAAGLMGPNICALVLCVVFVILQLVINKKLMIFDK